MIGARYDDDGASDSGAAYIFSEETTGVWSQVAKLTADDGAAGDNFGTSLAISGTMGIVGAPWGSTGKGAAYIFSEETPGVWIQVSKLTADDGADTDVFGQSVAILGTVAAVGAPYDDDLGSNGGSVYLFSESATPGVWTQLLKLTAEDGSTEDKYGYSVAMSEHVIVVGAYEGDNDFSAYSNTGAIYMIPGDFVDNCLESNLCEHAVCIDEYKTYSCDCPAAYDGMYCTECLCENNGMCQDDLDTGLGYCDCSSAHYAGDICASTFCNNGFSEAYPSTACNCTDSGAEGEFCTDDLNDCLSSPCMNNGLCSDFGDTLFPNYSNEYNCSCDGTGYHGPTCEVSDCISSPCLNNGLCSPLETLGVSSGIQCNCTNTGYEGDFCQSDVNDCASSPCGKGSCADTGTNSYFCDCTATGFEGSECQIDVDDCESSPCENGGSCADKGENEYQCTCAEGFTGTTCKTNIDDCASSPCLNDGTCQDGVASFSCECLWSWTGETCAFDSDDCISMPCPGGSTCIDGFASFTCEDACVACGDLPCILSDDGLSATCNEPITVELPGLTCDSTVVACEDSIALELWVIDELTQNIGGVADDWTVYVVLFPGGSYDLIVIYDNPEGEFADADELEVAIEQNAGNVVLKGYTSSPVDSSAFGKTSISLITASTIITLQYARQ